MAGETVLIVDDNLTNLKLARVLLISEGYDVVTASDADEAMEVLKQVHPQLILMDIQLPGMDGLQLTRRIKANPATANIVVVALTSAGGSSARSWSPRRSITLRMPWSTRACHPLSLNCRTLSARTTAP